MKKIFYLLFLSLFVFTSCNQENEIIDPVLKSKKDKVTLCHKGKIITVSGNALNAHLNHGDVQLVDADGDGWVEMENDCVSGGDCDDTDPLVNPGVQEICGNNVDDDCDGDIDEECTTYVPDDGFERLLISLGYDVVMDDYVLTSNINTVESLWLPYAAIHDPTNFSIYDLTGLEDFSSLITFISYEQPFSSIDFSGNTALTDVLMIDTENVTNINLSQNINLVNLDLSDLTFLESLDLSNNIALSDLSITSIPRITSLDLSQNINLTGVFIEILELEFLNLKNGNNTILILNGAYGSPTLCIQVDDADAANAGEAPYTNWTKEVTAIYSETCGN